MRKIVRTHVWRYAQGNVKHEIAVNIELDKRENEMGKSIKKSIPASYAKNTSFDCLLFFSYQFSCLFQQIFFFSLCNIRLIPSH
jgi:hypothetical protein